MSKYCTTKDEISSQEIAKELGVSRRCVDKTFQHAIEKIRNKLIEWGMYDELESAFADICQREEESWNRYFTKSSPYCR